MSAKAAGLSLLLVLVGSLALARAVLGPLDAPRLHAQLKFDSHRPWRSGAWWTWKSEDRAR